MITTLSRLIAFWVLYLPLASFSATYYYVDSFSGSDELTGMHPEAQGADGPWKTLARVNLGKFLPGDQIFFRCGGQWNESLVPPNSGAEGSPITFGSYGQNCNGSNKPIINGSAPITGWTVFKNAVYVAPALLPRQPRNLIYNGHLDASADGWWGWGLMRDWNSAGCETSGGCLAATGTSGAASTRRFRMEPGSYQIRYRLKASNPMAVNVVLNRDFNPPNVWSTKVAVGTGWTTFTHSVVTNANLLKPEEIRADFYFSDATNPTLYIDDVELSATGDVYDPVRQVFVDGTYLRLAQFPDSRGTDATDTYLRIASNDAGCPGSGSAGTSSFVASADLLLTTAQTQDLVGSGIHIRTNNYIIDDGTVTNYDEAARRLTFDVSSPTRRTAYNLCKDWGYYLDNKLWMLDVSHGWFYDPIKRQIYARLSSQDAPDPEGRTQVAHLAVGVDVAARRNITIDGLRIERTDVGIDLSSSQNIVIRNTDIFDSGINAIQAAGSNNASIEGNRINNTVRDGIGLQTANGFSITNNILSNLGFVGSPKRSVAAINGGSANSGLIDRNKISNSGYLAIYAGISNRITQNYIENSCLVLDDCGAIYTSRPDRNSYILNNIIWNVLGNKNGRPPNTGSSGQGIYLDEFASRVEATGNTIINTDYGFQLHKAANNLVRENTIYGSRKSPLWLQEDSGEGSINQNQFSENIFFSTNRNVQVLLDGKFQELIQSSAANTFESNVFGALYSDYVARNVFAIPASNNALLTFEDWQSKDQDLTGRRAPSFSVRPFRLAGKNSGNLVTNATFDLSFVGWNKYSEDGSAKLEWRSACESASGGCLSFITSQNTAGILSSNVYSVGINKSYLVEFKIAASADNSVANIVMRRSGPTYENVSAVEPIDIGLAWKRYSLILVTSTALTNARLDFDVPRGKTIYLDNVSITEVQVEYPSSQNDDSRIILNKEFAVESFACPDQQTERCSEYIDLNGEPLKWPVTLDPYQSMILVWRNNPFIDSDRDLVVDGSDLCLATIQRADVDSSGCSPGQIPKPLDLVTVPVARFQIDLRWKDSANNESGYIVERRDSLSSPFQVLGRNGANTTSYSDNTVASVTDYWYRVRAFNAGSFSDYTTETFASAKSAEAEGRVDLLDCSNIKGWARLARRSQRILVDIFDAGARLGQVLANKYRSDLAANGNDGFSGFTFKVPSSVRDGKAHRIKAIISIDNPAHISNGAVLPPTPVDLVCGGK